MVRVHIKAPVTLTAGTCRDFLFIGDDGQQTIFSVFGPMDKPESFRVSCKETENLDTRVKELTRDLDAKKEECRLAWDVINKTKTELTAVKGENEAAKKAIQELRSELEELRADV